jgi:zinc protease
MRLLAIDEEMQALSAADIQGAARRYLDEGNYVQVVLMPEAPAAMAKAAQQ